MRNALSSLAAFAGLLLIAVVTPPSADATATSWGAVDEAVGVAFANARVAVERVATAFEPPTAYYRNCTDVRAAGVAPLHRGSPGYRAELDGNDDGVACE